MGDRYAGKPSLTNHLGQLSLASLRVAKSSTSFGWGKSGNVTSAGWQVTLCDPIWHVSSRSGELQTAIPFFTLLFTLHRCGAQVWHAFSRDLTD